MLAAALVFVVASSALLVARLAPGDFTFELVGRGLTRETLVLERARLGLDRPVLQQYGTWLADIGRLKLGTSLLYGRPVLDLVSERALNTATLGLTALILATCLGLPLGVVSGSRAATTFSRLIRAVSLLSLSLPTLLTSLLLALFAVKTGWFPIGGMRSPDAAQLTTVGWLADAIRHLALPACALAIPVAATLERLQSRAIADALREPYITASLARGVPYQRLLWGAAWRVSLRPVLAVYGIIVGSLLSGSFAVEVVMSWPGLGRLMYDALVSRDVYLVAGCAAAGALFIGVASFLTDVALTVADPRLRERLI